jgi:hypothetical protein
MCVRGLDYLPVTDVTFGEYLRAILTADADLVPEDLYCYRIIMADAFRRRGVYQQGWLSMAPDSLYWEPPEEEIPTKTFEDLIGKLDLNPLFKRADIADQSRKNRAQIHAWLMTPDDLTLSTLPRWQRILGVCLSKNEPLASIVRRGRFPLVEVHSARIARRSGPDGQETREMIIEITQGRYGFNDPEQQKRADQDGGYAKANKDFIFRGGATLVIDLTDGHLRYAIRKRIDDDLRLHRQRRWNAGDTDLLKTYFPKETVKEPFAFMHRT